MGPSGVGKNTLLEGLLASVPNTLAAVSCTTRKPRPGEIEGKDYHFVSELDFTNAIQTNNLLQYVIYSGYFYGMKKDEIDNKLPYADVLVVVEPTGVQQLKAAYPDLKSLFLFGRRTEVYDRLIARGDRPEVINSRMATYDTFINYMPKCDYIINSGKPEHVLEDAITIIKRLKQNE